MPTGKHHSKRGPTPAGDVPRNPANLRRVYKRLLIAAPQTIMENEAWDWLMSLTPDERLDVITGAYHSKG